MFVDARVPVVFGEIGDAGPDDALLIDGGAEAPEGRVVVRLAAEVQPAHVKGCVCCVPRSAAGSALAGLFLSRGRGEVPFFRRVVAVTPDRQAVLDAIENDMLASGWFRCGTP
jgi:hypothetical protein